MEIVIDIPEEVKRAFDCAESNDLKGCYYDHGGIIGNAIKNGIPLTEDNDLISRKAAIERVDKEREYLKSRNMTGTEHILTHHLRNVLDDIPTVTPTRKKAKWICEFSKAYPGWKRCSNCHEPWTFNKGCPPFCPNCGAEMESD